MSDNPLFIVTNDDGVHAPGIQTIANALRKIGRVIVVAPHLEKSGTSSAITIELPILVEELGTDVYGIRGTPADCMMLALKGLIQETKVAMSIGSQQRRLDTLYTVPLLGVRMKNKSNVSLVKKPRLRTSNPC